MTRFARIHRNKNANIKAPEEATSWVEFKSQMKTKKEVPQEEEKDLSEFPEPEHYYDKHTYKSSWCDFEPDNEAVSKKKLRRFNENKINVEKSEELPKKSKKEKRNKRLKCDDYNNEEIAEVTDKHIRFGEDNDPKELVDENSHNARLKSKKKTKIRPVNEEENPIDISEGEKQATSEENRGKNKKRKFKEICSAESSISSNKRKFNRSDESNYQDSKVDIADDSSTTAVKKEISFARENMHGKNGKLRKKGPRNEMTLFVDGKNLKMTQFDGFYILETDAERIKKLKQKMIDEGRPKAEIEGVLKRHRRNAERLASKKKKKLCFHCREGVHTLSQCPKLDGPSGPVGSSICYKCGSTEHLLHQCKVPGKDLKFAKCFICNEVGHLSKHCPDNPRGLYPNGGGCRVCGDVTHLKRDCPELIKKRRNNTVTVGTIGDSIESLDDDRKPRSSKSSLPCKRVNKVIKFE